MIVSVNEEEMKRLIKQGWIITGYNMVYEGTEEDMLLKVKELSETGIGWFLKGRDVQGNSVQAVYDDYVEACEVKGVAPLNKIAFSRLVVQETGLKSVPTYISGNTVRCYMK